MPLSKHHYGADSALTEKRIGPAPIIFECELQNSRSMRSEFCLNNDVWLGVPKLSFEELGLDLDRPAGGPRGFHLFFQNEDQIADHATSLKVLSIKRNSPWILFANRIDYQSLIARVKALQVFWAQSEWFLVYKVNAFLYIWSRARLSSMTQTSMAARRFKKWQLAVSWT